MSTPLRYQDTGEVHLDFHRTTNGTIAYLRQKHGAEFLDDVFRHTAQDVYRSIWDDLKQGDPEQLVTHWTYFMEREKGVYKIEREGNEIRFIVLQCPATTYLRNRGIVVDPEFRRQTITMNQAWSEGTPFEITTKITGEDAYVQTIRRVKL
jgi:hypothetical protein